MDVEEMQGRRPSGDSGRDRSDVATGRAKRRVSINPQNPGGRREGPSPRGPVDAQPGGPSLQLRGVVSHPVCGLCSGPRAVEVGCSAPCAGPSARGVVLSALGSCPAGASAFRGLLLLGPGDWTALPGPGVPAGTSVRAAPPRPSPVTLSHLSVALHYTPSSAAPLGEAVCLQPGPCVTLKVT